MVSISGQFHAYSTKCTAKRLTDLDFLTRLEGRGDIEEQAHPASAVVDDDHCVIASEGAREADGSARRNVERRASRRRGTG